MDIGASIAEAESGGVLLSLLLLWHTCVHCPSIHDNVPTHVDIANILLILKQFGRVEQLPIFKHVPDIIASQYSVPSFKHSLLVLHDVAGVVIATGSSSSSSSSSSSIGIKVSWISSSVSVSVSVVIPSQIFEHCPSTVQLNVPIHCTIAYILFIFVQSSTILHCPICKQIPSPVISLSQYSLSILQSLFTVHGVVVSQICEQVPSTHSNVPIHISIANGLLSILLVQSVL